MKLCISSQKVIWLKKKNVNNLKGKKYLKEN